MLVYPYFANIYFNADPMYVGLFLGTAIHETSQVAAAGLIYDQQFNSPETLNVATVTKLIRNTFLVIMVPLIVVLCLNKTTKKNKLLLDIFPYFVLGFIGMIIFRNIGDQIFLTENTQPIWHNSVSNITNSAKVFLSMAMAAVGLSTNLSELKSMGYKPFVVGFIAMMTVGLVSIITMKSFTELFLS